MSYHHLFPYVSLFTIPSIVITFNCCLYSSSLIKALLRRSSYCQRHSHSILTGESCLFPSLMDPHRDRISTLKRDLCLLQGVSTLLSPAAYSWWFKLIAGPDTWQDVTFCPLPVTRTLHTLQFQISKGGDDFSPELMASALDLGFTGAETSCSEGSTLVCIRPQWRFYQSFTFPGAPQSDQAHPQSLHTGVAPQPIHTFARQGHPCCLLCPWRGTVGSPISGEAHPPPSWPDLVRFRPLVCQEGCSSIMWCGLTIVELFNLLQWCFSSHLDEFCYLHSELWSKVWQLYNCLPDIAGRGSWCSLTPNLKWARDKQH